MRDRESTIEDADLRGLPLGLSALAGFVGELCILAGASQPGSPFTLTGPGAWFFGNGAHVTVGVTTTNARFLAVMLVYVGIALMLGAWYEVVRSTRASTAVPLTSLAAIFVAWGIPILVMPPLFSRDVYYYAAQGEMVSRGMNPYNHGPGILGSSSFLRLVDPLWAHSVAPYGPVWERVSGWIVALSHHDVLAAVVGFRLIALLGVTIVGVAVPVLARGVGRDASVGFALAVLNPLVLLVLVGGAHNDALMLGLLVAGCAMARKGHVLAGLTMCALAAEVKIPALIGIAFIGWWWAGEGARWPRRTARLAAAAGFGVGVMAGISALSSLGWRWISILSTPGSVVSWLDPATGVGLALAHVASALGLGGHAMTFVDGARAVMLGLAAVIAVVLLVRSHEGDPGPIGWSLLIFVALGPAAWPWYDTWGLVFLAAVAEGWLLGLVFVLSAVACVVDVPRPRVLISGDPVLITITWTAFALALCLYVLTRVRPMTTVDASTATKRHLLKM